jgi:hypothetical protein
VSVREYRELVEGEAWPLYDVWERIGEFSGWPLAFVAAIPGARTSPARMSGEGDDL